MDFINLEPDIRLLRFSPIGKSFVGFNMMLIIADHECILIDTGYDRHFLEIQDYVRTSNITIKQVIISHFHNDHVGGLKLIKDIPVHGSIYAKDTLDKYRPEEPELLPTHVVIDEKKITFGRHSITIINNPGHSKDGTIIIINDKYMFVGDDVIRSHSGDAVIPFLADQDYMQQKSALLRIKELARDKILIPSHGMYLDNNFDIYKDLNDRVTYVDYFMKYPRNSYNQFVNQTMISFKGSKWHHYNIKRDRK